MLGQLNTPLIGSPSLPHAPVPPPPVGTRHAPAPQQSMHAGIIEQAICNSLPGDSLANVGSSLVAQLSGESNTLAILLCFDRQSKRFSIIGDSRGVEPNRRLANGTDLEQALAEAMLLEQDDANYAPPTPQFAGKQNFQETKIRRRLASNLGVEALRVRLIRNVDGNVHGALLLGGTGTLDSPLAASLMHPADLSPLANYLELRQRDDRTAWQHVLTSLRSGLVARRTTWCLLAAAIVASLCCIPVPNRVSAPCTCEPVTRRVISAPFDGRLLSCRVKPGDIVTKGQTLATMDGGETRIKLAATLSLQRQALQRYDAALAIGDPSLAAKESLELERLKQQIQLLHSQESQLQLSSPLDGVVVGGDMERTQGASVRTGQLLLEIAPLDKLLAEIEVDETDIVRVQPGAAVSVSFNGVMGATFAGTVNTVYPRAELRDRANIFVVEATLLPSAASLSPGMRGIAKIESAWQCLGWVVARKPYQTMRRFWGWY